MATQGAPLVPLDDEQGDGALQHTPWRKRARLSSVGDEIDRFLGRAGFDRGPWLAVAFAGGIALWFVVDTPGGWISALLGSILLSVGALAMWRGDAARGHLMLACVAVGLATAGGIGIAWSRSVIVGAPALERPVSQTFQASILERIEQPAEGRTRFVLATRDPATGAPIKIRINVPLEGDDPALRPGAVIRAKMRLMPPAPPMLPGSYNFARTAWFEGYAATGSVQGKISLITPGEGGGTISRAQQDLSRHVRSELAGTAGAIAAAFASGDRGGIPETTEIAMRDSGLTHLLSISGLHVSAVIAAAYVLAIRLLALFPWLALRVRLPLLAAGIGALAGICYTLLTGAQVPTVRSCIGAVLVLGALAMGREALSLRMVAAAAFFVLLLWPESLVGPSFQMSFAAVLAIVALHNSAPVQRFLAPRDESWLARSGRRVVMLLLTGLVIEIALMPIVLFHFHRAGIYGALANVIAIPLVTFTSMPLIALALFFDLAGAGAPFWWLAGQSLDLLLAIADFTASRPGAVKLMPQMGSATFVLFLMGGLWLALWKGRERLLGLVPAAISTIMLLLTPVPDVLVSGDGRHVGITDGQGNLYVLRETRSDFTRDNLMELAGVEAQPVSIEEWPGVRCSRDFCALALERSGRNWDILMSRSSDIVTERALAAACERADIVISDRWLPRSCAPVHLRADARLLSASGGLSLVLTQEGVRVSSVAQAQGQHGWWRGRSPE